MNQFYHSSTPDSVGSLHSFENETANCGMGALVNIHGERSYKILDYALTSVCNMTHRGAVDADMKSGDGSGVLTQIPYPIFEESLKSFGAQLKSDDELGVAVFFIPQEDTKAKTRIVALAEQVVERRGIKVLGWREVPVNPGELGAKALASQPDIQHLLMQRPAGMDSLSYERQLFLCRREIELETRDIQSFYMPTFSSRLISYKGLAMPRTLKAFYEDLQNPKFETAIALYHQRFSTNTFPAWPLGQPFRMMCHNGEINTVRGNRNWMASREEFFSSEIWGEDVKFLQNLLTPGESDSASLDHALELLVLSGRSLEHAMCMLVPPAYKNDPDMSESERGFFDFHHSFSEPWDGPAGLCYTDGIRFAASLDRNGLRPSRFTLLDDGLLYVGSESGAVILPDEKIIRRGRLGPGQMLSVDTSTGELRFDREIKKALGEQAPYDKWVEEHALNLRDYCSHEALAPEPEDEVRPSDLARQQITQGINLEDLDMVFPPLIKGAQEAISSMGDDAALAPLSKLPRNLFTYFKQLFAQVTNPPIDPIREWAVMTLSAGLGPEHNLLAETPEHAKVIGLESAILFDHELERIRHLEEQGFRTVTIDTTWPVSEGAGGLESALDRICKEAEDAVDSGYAIIILSDRAISKDRAPLPALLVTGGVHHHLNRSKKRMRTSIVVDTGEVRDTHQLACIFSFGGTAVCPYLGYATVRQLVRDDNKGKLGEGMTAEKGMVNYRKGLEKGVLKIMSKMGISVLNSYQGAQTFEALGVGQEVVDRCFTGTPSRIGGIGFLEIAEETLTRHQTAYSVTDEDVPDLGDPGYNRYRKVGELHALTTDVIKNFHTFVRSGKAEDYDDYVKAQLEVRPVGLKDLLEFKPLASGPVPLEEVEPIENIMRRFTTAAMSLGALSPEAHETLAIAMNRIGAKSDSGEGGEDPRRFEPYPNGDFARSAIKQIASGRFGVSAYYLVNATELEIKMAQGAKPGEGGQLPGHKVNSIIAKLRNTQPGVQLISPPPHHDIYSIEDLAQLIHDLKEVNPSAKVTVKLVAEAGVGTIAAGVAKASADVILVSGHEGGTAASPLTSTKHAGLPWELGISEAQQTLVLNGLRDRVTLRTDGGLKTGRDVVIAAIMGAEEFNFGTIAMIAMGCVYVRKCHLNNCPVGVATTDPKWRAKFRGTPEHVVNYFTGVANEMREHMAAIGVRKLDELIGHPELLEQREVPGHDKANKIDLSQMLFDVTASSGVSKDAPRICMRERNHGIEKEALDIQILKDIAEATEAPVDGNPCANLLDRPPVTFNYQVENTDRNIGTRVSGRVAELYKNHGLPDNTITINCYGTAGQSFGTFMAGGLRLNSIGEANDYTGKGMAGGCITVRPGEKMNPEFVASENSIIGNTVLYGATGGELYANGRAGERFCVRNSGAIAVVEGVGDHGCEYMTAGIAIILGRTGQNFGAGMSGGAAYVYDADGKFQKHINPEMVVTMPLKRKRSVDIFRKHLEKHVELTGSPLGKEMLENFEKTLEKMVRVIPKEKAALEKAEAQHEAAGLSDPVN